MVGYRNIAYLPFAQEVRIWTWDESGDRITYTQPYKPYLYTEDSAGTATSIFGTKLKKKVFNTQFDRSKFIKDTGLKRLFENLPPTQQFLIDEYWEHNETPEFNMYPLRVQFIDIEAVAKDEFPNPENAIYPINVITIYDTLDKHKYVWGMGEFDSSKYPSDELTYINCKTEKELLNRMLEFFERDYPDILSGWNSAGFDMPYIINRINNVLGEEEIHRMSPMGRVYSRAMKGAYGNTSIRWFIDGVSCIDYLDAYKRFQLKNRDSYRLDNIAQIEISENKLEYGNMHIADLMENDWQKFVEYNIHDVFLLQRLDEELKYIELLRMLSYIGLTTFEAAMGAISVINGAAAIRARYRDQKIITLIRGEDTGKNPGAYVRDPIPGFQEAVVSFDANSLYPSLMISLNMSPETKLGKILSHSSSEVKIQYSNGEIFNIPTDKFGKLVKAEQIAISKAGILFSQKRKGIMPELVDFYYSKRVEVKDKLKIIKHQISEIKSSNNDQRKIADLQLEENRLDTKQLTIKVLINSCYGYFGNSHAPIGDDDIASSITLCGQAAIKESGEIAKRFIKERSGATDEYLKINDPIIYGDTDSIYISLKPLLSTGVLEALADSDNKITPHAYAVCDDLEKYLNDNITEWAKRSFNTVDCRLLFKREAIGDIGIFLEKKRYALHILDDEGIQTSKFKYTGVEVVRTTMPVPVKPHVKRIIETMMLTQSQPTTDRVVREAYDVFISLPVEDVSFVVGLTTLDEYVKKCRGFDTVKGMPVHAKAAHYYNLILKDLGLDSVYESAQAGDKIRWMYVRKSNKYGISVIGFKNSFPPELASLFQIDYDKMFNKIVFSVVERFYNCVSWIARRPNDQIRCDLFDIFGE